MFGENFDGFVVNGDGVIVVVDFIGEMIYD